MSRLEFPLAQGWAKGLTLCFEDAATSRALDLSQFISVKQVHGKEIVVVNPADAGKSVASTPADGLIVQGDWFKECARPLVIQTADCLPLFYIDRDSQSVAALHAGWRGLAAGIHEIPFEKKYFNPKTTWAWVGPSLSGPHFEVGPDMWTQFSKTTQQDPTIFEALPPSNSSFPNEKKLFHAWRFLEKALQTRGVDLVYNVEVDTFTSPHFASYRRDYSSRNNKIPDYKNVPGERNLSWIGFKKPYPS